MGLSPPCGLVTVARPCTGDRYPLRGGTTAPLSALLLEDIWVPAGVATGRGCREHRVWVCVEVFSVQFRADVRRASGLMVPSSLEEAVRALKPQPHFLSPSGKGSSWSPRAGLLAVLLETGSVSPGGDPTPDPAWLLFRLLLRFGRSCVGSHWTPLPHGGDNVSQWGTGSSR